MCHGMGLTASRLTCSRSVTAAAAAVALSWLPSLDLQSLRNRGSRRRGNGAGCCTRSTCSRSATEAAAAVAMGNRGSRRSGNGAGCCPRPTCSDRQSLRNRGSRRSGNGAGCCTRSTYSDRQSLRNRGSRRSSGNGACGCTALVLRGSSLPRTRQPLTRRRCSCEGLSAAASASGPMPEPADRRSAVQLWVLLVAQRRYTGSRMPAPQRQRLGCGGCMDGRAEQGSSQAAEKR